MMARIKCLGLFMLTFSLLLLYWAQGAYAEPRVAPHVYGQGEGLKERDLGGNRPSRPLLNLQRSGENLLLPSAQDNRANHTQWRIMRGEVPMADPEQMPTDLGDWRLKIASAAIARDDVVRLGDIAQPIGHLGNWQRLKETELWASPPEAGKPMQINRSNLSQALNERLGRDIASRCILPTSLVLQKGGLLVREEDLRTYVLRSLNPIIRSMPGEVECTDFHLPEYIFLAHEGQRVQLEQPKLSAGRVGLRFAILEADGEVLRRVSGSITLTQWVTVPAAARSLSKGDNLTPEMVTFSRMNAKRLKEPAWDGRGGPWKLMRSLAPGEPILQSDLATQMMVRRGEIVTLIYARGNLILQTQAEALSDGEPGAKIPVRNLQSKKQVYATVRNAKTVVIQ